MIHSRRISCVCAALLLSVALGRSPLGAADSAVESLIKVVPEDAIAFVAAGGGDALKGDFDKSILGRIWTDPGVRSFCQTIKAQVIAKVEQQAGDRNEAKPMKMAVDLARLLGSRPIVLGIGPLKMPVRDRDKPPIYGFAVVDAGPRKVEFEAAVKELEAMAGQDRITDVNVGSARMRGPKDQRHLPLYWGWLDNYLVVAANDVQGLAMQSLQKPRTALPEYLKKVPVGGDALVVHVDLEKTIRIVDALARQEDPKTADAITAVLKELGLSGVKTFTSRAGFAGADVVAGSFLEAPGPRTGLLAALKPADLSIMDLVDARAVTAGTANCDVGAAYDTIMRAIKTAAGEDFAEVEKGIAAFESQTKVNLRKGLIESLAGPAVFYSFGAGSIPEAPMGGVVVAIKVKDAGLFEQTMTALGDFAASQSKGTVQVSSQAGEDGRTVHTWVIPPLAMVQVMPTWSMAKDYVVLGSNSALYRTAVQQVTSGDGSRKSLRSTEGYKEATAKLPGNLISLRYADSQGEFNQMMMGLQQVWPMATLFAARAGVKLPALLPSLGNIAKDMKPSCRASWMGPDGFCTQCRGPGVDVSMAGIAGVGVAAGVAMPALARAREQARQAVSMSNLKQIGLALHMYADDNGGVFPPDLQGMQKYLGSPKALESPRKPKDFAGPSYIYVSGQTGDMDAHNMVAYENPEFAKDRVCVLFLDGHVETMKPDQFRRDLEVTYKRLGRPMPDIGV